MTTGYAHRDAPLRMPAPAAWSRPRIRPTPTWWKDAIGVATWASVLVTVALWVADGGIQDVLTGGLASELSGLGRLTALLSADLLLVQVLLLARIPVLERSFGQDTLAAWHRWVGFASFVLLADHIGLTTLGESADSRVNPVREFVEIVVDYPGMLMAFAATVMLTLVVVTSIRIARSRLRYESWHLLHLYAYLGVGLAIPHEVWTGRELESRVATLYWCALWAAAAGAVLTWRVGVPLYRSWRHRLVVEGVVTEAPGIVSVYLTGRDLDRLGASAGQFFTWRFLAGPGWTRGHPYSLSAAPTRDRLRITVKDLGDGSRALARLRPGTRALIEGPYGRLHGGVRTRRKVTLIGAGIGITPLRALLESLPHHPGELTLIYRAHDASELALRAELDTLAAASGARVFYVLGPRLPGRSSWLPASAAHLTDAQALRELVPDVHEHDVYLCGADAWMAAARAAALEAGVPGAHVHVERFSW